MSLQAQIIGGRKNDRLFRLRARAVANYLFSRCKLTMKQHYVKQLLIIGFGASILLKAMKAPKVQLLLSLTRGTSSRQFVFCS